MENAASDALIEKAYNADPFVDTKTGARLASRCADILPSIVCEDALNY